uniref:Ribosomal silencing factor RsfS n=1 Tax=Fervidobacterium thailandense TaxID=1008305 RepID=A0A7C4VSS0_9BACT
MELLRKLKERLDKKEAMDIVILNMSKTRLLTDYFVICTANSTTHLKSLRDEVVEFFEEIGKPLIYYDRGEGYDWILIDAGEIVVHIFLRHAREFYDIENLWIDAERVRI